MAILDAPDQDRARDERPEPGEEPSRDRISRRGLLGLGAATAGAAVAAGGVLAAGDPASSGAARPSPDAGATGVIPFRGTYQSGIATPVQDRMHMVALDLTTSDRGQLVRMLRSWTVAAEAMTAGRGVGTGAIPDLPQAAPDDTGEALGLPASRLTVTIGFGAGVFERDGADPLGLRAQRPEALIDLPRFAGDQIDPARSGGDILVQACADDPQVAVHAVRNLVRLAFGTAAVRWSQLGFGKTSSTTPDSVTPRNLFGFKDGTNNIAGTDQALLAQHVWVDAAADASPAWIDGGTYLVARRIAMRIETWDRSPLAEQEGFIGRQKFSGAPLDGVRERDPVTVANLPADSHVSLVQPSANDGHRMLRRGYSFVDGSDGIGRLDAGLFFLAFVRDPRTQFVPMQSRLSRQDALSEYLVHTASGLYAIPPGLGPGEYWGQSLLEA